MKVISKLFPIVFITALSYHLLMVLHGVNLETYAIHTISPITGHAWWRAFQNRLLAGFIVDNISNNIVLAYQIFIFFSLLAMNFLTYYLYKDILPVIALAFMFLGLQGARFLYGWDFLDLIILTTLLILIDKKVNIWGYMILFAVAIFNRESALFIPAWLIIDHFKRKEMWYGFIMLISGYVIINLLRDMFVTSIYPSIGLDESHRDIGNSILFAKNIQYFFRHYDSWNMGDFAYIPALMISSVLLCWNANKKILLLTGFIILQILIFGCIHETRVWFITIPFIIYLFIRKETYKNKC